MCVFVCLCNCLSANAVIPAFSCMRAPSGQTERPSSRSFLPFGILHLSLFLGQFDNHSPFPCYPCHPLYIVDTPFVFAANSCHIFFSFNLRWVQLCASLSLSFLSIANDHLSFVHVLSLSLFSLVKRWGQQTHKHSFICSKLQPSRVLFLIVTGHLSFTFVLSGQQEGTDS